MAPTLNWSVLTAPMQTFLKLKPSNTVSVAPSQRSVLSRSPLHQLVDQISAQERPMQLLLQVLQADQNQTTRLAIAQLIHSGINWATFLALGSKHRVVPLLHQQIQTHYTDCFPPEICQKLATERVKNTARNMGLSKKLLDAIALLHDQGIPALTFKGPVLATLLYGDISARIFADVDILVPSDRFLAAKTTLIEAGYHSSTHSRFLIPSEQYENRLLCKSGECTLESADRFVHIDLHQRLVAGDFFRMARPLDAAIWQHPHTTELLGHPVQTLSVEDLLLYLCVHGAKDLWKQLSWLCDIATLLQHPTFQTYTPLQWERLLAKAHHHHLESMVWMGLTLVQTLLGVSLPDALKQLPSTPNHQVLLNRTVQRLVQPCPTIDKPFNLMSRFWFRFQFLDSLQDKWLCLMAFFGRLIYPTYIDTQFIPLPRSLHGLYWLIRPFRLVREQLR